MAKDVPHSDMAVSVDIGDKVRAAQSLMSEKKVRHLPVLRDGELVSIVTDRDINLALVANKELTAAEQMTVGDVCALQLYKVEADTPLDQVVNHMAEHTVGSVIVTRDGKLAGIFTATDACKYLGMCLRSL